MSGIYIHVPFCRSHCTYCGFYSEFLRRRDSDSFIPSRFVEALCREIELSEDMEDVRTLYMGGGTPSLLSADQIGGIASAVRRRFAVTDGFLEFTVEVNPDDIVRGGVEYAAALLAKGVSRVSMGLQSFDDRVLKRMGRRHTAAEAIRAYGILCSAGFDNISIDLIFGFDENFEVGEVERGLDSLSGQPFGHPQHISCYQLSIEEGSGLEKMMDRGLYSMPDDDVCAAQYEALCALFRKRGYEHYEVSNWALPGFRSCHNGSYWNHTPYLGFGPGAHSLLVRPGEGCSATYVRRWNRPDFAGYVSALAGDDCSIADALAGIREQETLNEEQVREERIMLGLRTSEGIDPGLLAVQSPFLEEAGGGRLRIPERLWFVSDSIITDLV